MLDFMFLKLRKLRWNFRPELSKLNTSSEVVTILWTRTAQKP